MLRPVDKNEERFRRPSTGVFGLVKRLVDEHPYIALFVIIMGSNAVGSIFNIAYNLNLVVARYLNDAQKAVFFDTMNVYNVVMYPLGLAIMVYLFTPLVRCRRMLRAGDAPPIHLMYPARRRLLNLPFFLIFFNLALWLPGAVWFPLSICWFGGMHMAKEIWVHFGVSFVVSACITAAQTFFMMEWFLMTILYPEFFRDVRPAEVRGVLRISFGWRLVLLWSAVALMPLVSLLAVALNPALTLKDEETLHWIALGVFVIGVLSGGLISWIVGRDLLYWLQNYGKATEEIRGEHFSVRLPQKRPDEWGRLNDRFNDMASGLEIGRQVHETFGQHVGLDLRGDMLALLNRLGGEVRDITICFLDIRGFTRRSANERPERVVELLNGFLTLAVAAVKQNEGLVNKFLGDGLMAIFGGPLMCHSDHADQAVQAAIDLVHALEHFNDQLKQRGEEPLKVGIGIHTGPALVGCIGATSRQPDGRDRGRKEYTAIGATVNNCQRIEQLTKTLGCTILISAQTYAALRRPTPVLDHGQQQLERSDDTLHIYEVNTALARLHVGG